MPSSDWLSSPSARCSLLAGPAGAQQLVDAGKEGDGSGGLAFVLMVVMVVAIAGSLFFMDHVRRNRLHQDDDTPSVVKRRAASTVWSMSVVGVGE